MGNREKVWVIRPTRKSSGSRENSGGIDASRIGNLPDEQGDQKPRMSSGEKSYSRPVSLFMAMASYFLGPFTILASKTGRENSFWVFMSAFSGLLLALFLIGLSVKVIPGESSSRLAMAWILSGLAGVLIGSVAWSRGLVLAARKNRAALKSMPHFLRKPLGNGILGMIFPGLGLYLTRHRARAAAAVWSLTAVALSAIVLHNRNWLWMWQKTASRTDSLPRAVEYLFISAAAAGLLGMILWIFQALDGARLAGKGKQAPRRAGGDLAAVTLIIAIIAFSCMFQRESVARFLDDRGSDMLKSGYRVIPLGMASAAGRLDPSRPEYSVRVMEIHREMGNSETAASIRAELVKRLIPCSEFIHQSGLARMNQAGTGGETDTGPGGITPGGEESVLAGPDFVRNIGLPPI